MWSWCWLKRACKQGSPRLSQDLQKGDYTADVIMLLLVRPRSRSCTPPPRTLCSRKKDKEWGKKKQPLNIGKGGASNEQDVMAQFSDGTHLGRIFSGKACCRFSSLQTLEEEPAPHTAESQRPDQT